MPATTGAIVVILIALLPGALYVWTFERQVGRWGIGLSDRLLRFVGWSALFHLLAAPISYFAWTDLVPEMVDQRSVSLWWWLYPLMLALVPSVAGLTVGYGLRTRSAWALKLAGASPAPRAWDHLFAGRPDGWVRLKLKSGPFLGGVFADVDGVRSYASGYPESQEIFLASSVPVDPDTGEFQFDEAGGIVLSGGGLLVRWEEVEYLEFIDVDPEE